MNQAIEVYVAPGNIMYPPNVYCGTGSFSVNSVGDSIKVRFRSAAMVGGPGRFMCKISTY